MSLLMQLMLHCLEFDVSSHVINDQLRSNTNENNHYTLFADAESHDMCESPKKRLEDLMHLAELCIDLLQQNEEHHAEVLKT